MVRPGIDVLIKNIEKLICVLLLLYGNSASAGVDCREAPHTRLEIAICGEPVLRAIDQELTQALSHARQRGVIDRSAAHKQRNKIARQCRREADESLNSCLHNAELRALEWVAVKLGEMDGSVADKNRDIRERLREGRVHQNVILQKQLRLAESRMRRTGNPELTVATIIELIQLNDERQPNGGSESKVIAQLDQRLATGCSHAVYGKKWRRIIARRGMSCDKLQRRASALYSSSERY